MVFVNILGLWGVSAVIFKLWKEYEHDKNLDTTLNDILNDKKENVDISL